MKKIISITSYNDPNLLVYSEGLQTYHSSNEEVLSGVLPQTRYCDLAQTGSEHGGSEGDPWSWADAASNVPGLNFGSTVYIKGMAEVNSFPLGIFPWVIFDKWTGLLGSDDPWRIQLSYENGLSTFNARNIVMRNGIFYLNNSDARLQIGNTPVSEMWRNMIIRHRGGGTVDLDFWQETGDFPVKGCTFQIDSGDFNAVYSQESFHDCTFNVGGTITQSGGTFTTYNSAFNVTSAIGNHTDEQWNWSTVGLPAWNASKENFAAAVQGANIETPPQPGDPPYTGYATGPWGETRTGIGAFYFASAPTPPAPTEEPAQIRVAGTTQTPIVDPATLRQVGVRFDKHFT